MSEPRPSPRRLATKALAEDFVRRYPQPAAAELDEFSPEEVRELFDELDGDAATPLFAWLRPDVATRLLVDLGPESAAPLLAGADPSRAALALSRLDEAGRDAFLAPLDRTRARELREIVSYPPDTAGSIMDPRVNHFRLDESVSAALARLRAQRHLRVHNLHVVNDEGVYKGSVRLQDVALGEPDEPLGGLLRPQALSVSALAPLHEVVELLEAHDMATLPVVDFEERLVGVIRHEALFDAVEADASSDIQAMVGVSRAERALSPISFAVRKRLPWLQINLLTAFLAAFVVGLFEETIAQVTALAVLLPVVAGQSGNTGAQALAVTMRGLALREIRVRQAGRIALKECLVGALNGVAVSLVTAAAVYLWSGSLGLTLVIGSAMILSMVIAGLAGATIPMVLTLLGQDPAQSSSIILTTVTDVAGFLSFLGLATLMMRLL